MNATDKINEMLRQGESLTVEFKSTFDRETIETLADLATDHYQSQTRNKLLAEDFYLTKNIEKYGSGLIRIRKELDAYPGVSLLMEETSGGVLVTFALTVQEHERVSEGVTGLSRLSEQVLPEDAAGLGETREKTREKLIYALQDNPTLTTEELAALLSITPKGVEWQLSRLKSEGVLRRVGPAKGGHWEVVGG